MSSEVTRILSEIQSGDERAAAQLLPLVYQELRKVAAGYLARERAGHTLQTTALVHEAYVRLVGGKRSPSFRDEGHFFGAAAGAMRRILIENARRRRTIKRGGDRQRESLDALPAPEQHTDLLALDEALARLAACDPIKAQLVELRYFGGLTGEQAAAVLGVSPTTADRYWAFARAWLLEALQDR